MLLEPNRRSRMSPPVAAVTAMSKSLRVGDQLLERLR